MLRLAATLLLGSAVLGAAEEWVRIESEHFELVSNTKPADALAVLNSLEQFRWAVATTLGQKTIDFQPPARVYFFRSTTEARSHQPGQVFTVTKEKTMLALSQEEGFSTGVRERLARRLIETNLDRMPPYIEKGLLAYLSTVRIEKTRITAGDAPARRDLDWARIHLLAVHPDFSGKLPVLLRNLGRGVEDGVAYRNSLGVDKPELERRVKEYLGAGRFETVSISGLPIDPRRDWTVRTTEAAHAGKLLAEIADALKRAAEYEKLLADAAAAKDDAFAAAALRRAIELEPKRIRAYRLLAAREADASKRIEVLRQATTVDRRDAAIWNQLAEVFRANRQYSEAAKAWLSAEQAATETAEREKYRKARLDLERLRLDAEEAERKRVADEKERELRKLKELAIAEIRAAEARVNRDSPKRDPNEKVVEWWDGPKASGKARGQLIRVECLGRQAKLHVKTEQGAVVKLMIRDPGQIVVKGSGDLTLGCGAYKSRQILVEYFSKPDAAQGTAGEVASIEFPQ
ncbi:MAG: tetratricopeptide repeat protein [Bryobacteraceae bacterium]